MHFDKFVRVIGAATAAAIAATAIAQAASSAPARFRVQIVNISKTNEFTASNGTHWTLDFSRGVWYVSSAPAPLFSLGSPDRGRGLKSLSEDGDPAQLASSLASDGRIASSGKFTIAVGASVMKGIRPGRAFEFVIEAKPPQRLGIATMFGQSNDWFYAPRNPGIALFDAAGRPIGGDVSAQIGLWDAGTEADEEPGIGPNQGPRQKHTNSGPPDPDTHVRAVTDARFAHPVAVMRITVTPL